MKTINKKKKLENDLGMLKIEKKLTLFQRLVRKNVTQDWSRQVLGQLLEIWVLLSFCPIIYTERRRFLQKEIFQLDKDIFFY